MIFTQNSINSQRLTADQWKAVQMARNAANVHERIHAAAMREHGFSVNEGLIPRDVYQEFDRTAAEVMRSDNGDAFLLDLMANSRSVSIGKIVSKYRQVSDAGVAQTSMTGQIGVKLDQTENTYDGTIVPVHDAGFGRNWRELAAGRSEGFDALVDDNREVNVTLRAHMADTFLDGHTDKDGNYIKVDALDWQGMRNDSRVAQVDLGAAGVNFDFTDTTKTGAEIKAAWIEVRDTLWIDNNCEQDAVYYISREMASNFERKFSTSYDAKTIQQELADLQGVKEIKTSSKLSGNEFMAMVLDGGNMVVRPIVGMNINTVAMPRPVYNSDYAFVVWSAVGWQVRNDYNGQTCALFAQV
jgi:hypothetical protein